MRLIIAALVAVLTTVTSAPAQRQTGPFVFGKIDLKLLNQCEALDKQIEERALVYHDDALEGRLANLAAPLLPSDKLDHVNWRFRILRDPAVNAFGLPNGSIYLNMGLLSRAENDDQVAGRLAHEIAHVASRHAYQCDRLQRNKIFVTEAAEVAAALFAGMPGAYVVESLANKQGQAGVMAAVLGYPREFEREADESAVQRLRHAGRDPVQLVRLYVITSDRLDPEPIAFWPEPATRQTQVAYLKSLTGLQSDPGPAIDGGYLDRVWTVVLQAIQLDLNAQRFRSAVAGAQRLTAARPDDAVALFWLGESYRALGPRRERLTESESTGHALSIANRQAARRTEEDEFSRLAGTAQGKAALEANQRKAEELFRKAGGIDPLLPDPYFGLGSLYEQEGKKGQAAEAYRKYIELCREPADKERARRRLEELTKSREGAAK
jgi:tetratricopeptide (TPR) repeat protein